VVNLGCRSSHRRKGSSMNTDKPLALIIEDDEDLSIIFSEALNAAGFQTETIRNGQLALDRLHLVTPEVVSLDMHLPGVSGLDILKYIRSEKRLAMTNVVVTTADAVMAEHVRETADFVLIKPITFGQLRDLTARLSSASVD
jgi:two-component system, OmpR family, response regulator AdeR